MTDFLATLKVDPDWQPEEILEVERAVRQWLLGPMAGEDDDWPLLKHATERKPGH
jgi:hypothetical protein